MHIAQLLKNQCCLQHCWKCLLWNLNLKTNNLTYNKFCQLILRHNCVSHINAHHLRTGQNFIQIFHSYDKHNHKLLKKNNHALNAHLPGSHKRLKCTKWISYTQRGTVVWWVVRRYEHSYWATSIKKKLKIELKDNVKKWIKIFCIIKGWCFGNLGHSRAARQLTKLGVC